MVVPGCGLFRYEREQHQLRRMEKLANAYKHLRDEPLELFRDDYRSHSGGASCRPQVRYQVHGQHRRRKYGGERSHGDNRLLFPPLGVRGFREHFESEHEREEQTSAVRLLFRREQQNQVQALRHEYRRCLVAPFSVCELLRHFRDCAHRRHSQLRLRIQFPRLRPRLLRMRYGYGLYHIQTI